MKIKYCLPIIKNSKYEVLKTVEKNRNEYDYLEIWLDPIKDVDSAFIDKLIYMLQDKLILLFHRGNTIETKIPIDKKKEILDLLDNSQSFIDLDVSEKEELAYLKKVSVKTIISYHNYKETPKFDTLKQILTDMVKYKPEIYKIATQCSSENDVVTLLQLELLLREQSKRHIILGMGKFGTITRVCGTLWGNEMIYAPLTKEQASAPGQITKKQLETIFAILNN